MVRAHMKQPSEEKKETLKKKTPPKKKPVLTGVWPCKINGCNKQFAREADLKRHQRTTKLHSMPGFACPQCDATFTRTDALRRHQKSRHNGVIIEPTGTEKAKDTEDNEARSSGSKSRSRSGTPSGKNKEGATPLPTALAQPGTAGPSGGPSSYYRQHTTSSGTSYIPSGPPPGVPIDPQYPQGVALPTSATRHHQASWPPPPPWVPEGQVPAIGQIPHLAYHQVAGPHAIYYQPSPYYRPNVGILAPHTQNQINPDLVRSQEHPNGRSSNGSAQMHNESSPHSVVVDPQLSQLDSSPVQRTMEVETASHVSDNLESLAQSYTGPVIDPSLDGNSAADAPDGENSEVDINERDPEQITPLSLKITQAAMEAVLESVRREGHLVKATTQSPRSPGRMDVDNLRHDPVSPNDSDIHRRLEVDADADADGEADGEMDEHLITTRLDQVYHPPPHLGRPEPMDHILTEDGEPMLNPAELLTQESLASPPPS